MILSIFIRFALSSSTETCGSSYGIDTDQKSLTFNQCIPCTNPECWDCSLNAYNCTRCKYDYYVDSDADSKTYNNCVSCSHHCSYCTSPKEHCTRCHSYAKYNGKDQCTVNLAKNLPHCLYGTNNKCDICEKGFGPNEDGNCIKCTGQGCISCDTNASYCNSCAANTYINNYNGGCTKCGDEISNCLECERISGEIKCNKCETGYSIIGGKCYANKCSEHCASCYNETKCYTCEPGYGLTSDATCQLCNVSVPNCMLCPKSTVCRICDPGYSLTLYANCDAYTIEHCYDLVLGICRECEKGYYLDISTDRRTCVEPTVTNCELYEGSKCTKCLYPNRLDVNTNKCESNSVCKPHCNCYYKTCDSCLDGYRMVDNSCEAIPIEGCARLNKNDECTSCLGGYEMIDDICTKCNIENCDDCSLNINFCKKCKEGFGLDLSPKSPNYGKCHACTVDHCSECDNFADSCTRCVNGYEWYYNTCLKIPDESSDGDGDDNDDNDDTDNDDDENNNNNGNNNNELPQGAIIGIVVGCIVVVALVAFLLVFFLVIKKKNADASTSEAKE